MACGEARGGMSARDALSATEHVLRPPVEERRGRSPKMALYHYAAVDNVEYERRCDTRVARACDTRTRARESEAARSWCGPRPQPGVCALCQRNSSAGQQGRWQQREVAYAFCVER